MFAEATASGEPLSQTGRSPRVDRGGTGSKRRGVVGDVPTCYRPTGATATTALRADIHRA